MSVPVLHVRMGHHVMMGSTSTHVLVWQDTQGCIVKLVSTLLFRKFCFSDFKIILVFDDNEKKYHQLLAGPKFMF